MTLEWHFLWYFHPLAVLLAGLSDWVLGDPPRWPHPVRWLGQGAYRLETFFRKWPIPPRWQGILFTLCVGSITLSTVAFSLAVALWIHPGVGLALQVVWLHFGLAAGDLSRALQRVEIPLQNGNLEQARYYVGWIVSRDTESLDESGVCRSAIESGAENTVDGIVAPWFWALVGGPLGLWLFKAASTLDSQVGYKTPRHLHFGWASARLDDAFNWIPARFALLVFSAVGLLQKGWNPVARAGRVAQRDHALHPSPNAGLAESWMAGYLDMRLMGPNHYHGQWVEKPWLGADGTNATLKGIQITRHWIQGCALACWALAGCTSLCLSIYLYNTV